MVIMQCAIESFVIYYLASAKLSRRISFEISLPLSGIRKKLNQFPKFFEHTNSFSFRQLSQLGHLIPAHHHEFLSVTAPR